MLFHMCSLHRVQGTFNTVKNCAQALEAFVESKCVLPELPSANNALLYFCKELGRTELPDGDALSEAFFGGGQFPSLQALFIRETMQ